MPLPTNCSASTALSTLGLNLRPLNLRPRVAAVIEHVRSALS